MWFGARLSLSCCCVKRCGLSASRTPRTSLQNFCPMMLGMSEIPIILFCKLFPVTSVVVLLPGFMMTMMMLMAPGWLGLLAAEQGLLLAHIPSCGPWLTGFGGCLGRRHVRFPSRRHGGRVVGRLRRPGRFDTIDTAIGPYCLDFSTDKVVIFGRGGFCLLLTYFKQGITKQGVLSCSLGDPGGPDMLERSTWIIQFLEHWRLPVFMCFSSGRNVLRFNNISKNSES